jgi:hypothetical protein
MQQRLAHIALLVDEYNTAIVVREPVQEAYGIVSVFKDKYGNLWDLIG